MQYDTQQLDDCRDSASDVRDASSISASDVQDASSFSASDVQDASSIITQSVAILNEASVIAAQVSTATDDADVVTSSPASEITTGAGVTIKRKRMVTSSGDASTSQMTVIRDRAGRSELKCAHCPYVTTHPGNMSRHARVHSGEKFQCDKCEMLYASKAVLLQHYRLVHGAPLTCDCCSKTFRSHAGLALHLRRQRGDYQFTCDVCGKGFLEKVSYEGHMRKHQAVSPFKCVCGKAYRYKCSYVVHKRNCRGVSQAAASKEIRCGVCEKVFNSKATLKEHVIAKHSNNTYKCERCCEIFKWRPSYTRHVKSCKK